jgi:hypothetical protein
MFYERHIKIIAVTAVIKSYTIIFPDQEDLVDDRMKKNSSSNDKVGPTDSERHRHRNVTDSLGTFPSSITDRDRHLLNALSQSVIDILAVVCHWP